jgi:Tfp pilus assembly protein PilO
MAGAFYVGAYLPKTNEAADLAGQLRAQQTILTRLQTEVRRGKDAEREIADVQSATAALEAKLTAVRDVPGLVEQLDVLANQTGVTVSSIKPGVPQAVEPAGSTVPPPRTPAGGSHESGAAHAARPPAAKYQKFSIEVETRGTFTAIVSFVEGLESLPRFLAVSDMRVIVPPLEPGDNANDPVLELSVTATTYAPPEKEAGP